MKKLITVFMSFILSLICMLAASGCAPEVEEDPYAALDRSNIYGIDEPVLETKNGLVKTTDGKYTHTVEGFDMKITAELIGALGVKSIRFRIPQSFMLTAGDYNKDAYEYLKEAYTLLKDAGVELFIGLIDYFPRDTGFVPETSRSVPKMNDPYYDDWMNSLTEHCKTTCELFPEITYWEMGNEMNTSHFFHPNGWVAESGTLSSGTNSFSYNEQVEVYTDYMYYAAKGIHAANPENKAITGAYAFTTRVGNYTSIEYFIRDTYDLIKEGKAPSNVDTALRDTDPRHYFDGFSWHPYTSSNPLDYKWVEGNNQIYQAVIDNGDEGLPVVFTEFGYHDDGNEELEEIQIEYMNKAFEYVKNDMPYVISLCAFRMYQCSHAMSWGSTAQNWWGYFTEYVSPNTGFIPRAKAIALQKLYGGTGDLYKYADLTQ